MNKEKSLALAELTPSSLVTKVYSSESVRLTRFFLV